MEQNVNDRFADMWRRSREDAGKSQDYLAKKLGVSKKTIQNWESGFSSPSQIMGFKWFKALDLQPLPYYLSLLYGDFEEISQEDNDDKIEDALLTLVKGLSPTMKRQLLFILYGDYGSSPRGVIELFVAYLHSPIIARLSIAQAILTNYEISEAYKTTAPHIKPDLPLLRELLEKHKETVIEKKKSFIGGNYE